MDEIKSLVNSKNVLQLSKSLQKIAKTIEDRKKEQNKLDSTSAELNFLKEQCLSKNIQLSILSCQTFFGLMENGVIEPANGLTTFMTMLSSASTTEQLTALAEGIISILLLDLKIAAMQSNAKKASYICPFGLKGAQHPIISLLQKTNYNILDLVNKINGIHNHSDEHIKSNSLEFLRPVYSYIFCSPSKLPESLLIWNGFLECRSNNNGFVNLIYDIFRWSRVTSEKRLNMAMQLVDAMKISLNDGKLNQANDFQMYLIAFIPTLLESGNDPRPFLGAIYRFIETNAENQDLCDYNLISMTQIIHKVPAFYLIEALQIVKTLVENGATKNYIISNMILDALILRLAINGKSLASKSVYELNRLIKFISKQKSEFIATKYAVNTKKILYFHPTMALNWSLADLSSKLCDELSKNETKILDHMLCIIKCNQAFSEELHLFLRGLILSEKIKFDHWLQIFNQILANARSNDDISNDTIYFMLYYLAKETDGKKQLELLRGLTAFASVKQNIPLIMNTYRLLSTSNSIALRCLAIDLHTRLWHVESRTYQFLQKLLAGEENALSKADRWEMNIAKAGAIRDICSENASLHGTDLVGPLSKILNNSSENDLARAWTLDAVISLCKSHTVNIVSTWKVLRGAFETKLDLRTTKSLCQFFGEVPLLKSPTDDYEKLYEEALQRLWSFVIDSDVTEIIECALLALRNFDFTELTLKHMPTLFYENIHIPKEYQKQIEESKSNAVLKKPITVADVMPYIPGECWIEFLRKINQNAIDAAIEFVAYFIETEMLQYRSGVYMLPEGRPEPNDMKQLHARSPLRAIIRYIKEQSEWNTDSKLAIKCLHCISRKYSRPMPPLNWFFLIEYMNHATKFADSTATERFEMKMEALKITSNQAAHSGSARNLIENYLQQFDADAKDLDEIILLLKLIPTLCMCATSRILAAFLKNTLTFLYQHSLSSHFEENCHFEQAIVALMSLFNQTQPTNENIDNVIDELGKFNELLDSEMRIYERYADCLLKLSSDNFERLTTPGDWNISQFRKVSKLRFRAVAENKPYTSVINSWMWLNSLIDNVSDAADPNDDLERKKILLTKISELLLKDKDDTKLCEWLAYFLGKVQANFTSDGKNEKLKHSLFCLDLFIYCLVFTSGCSIFLNGEYGLENRHQWLNKLPQALWMLTQQKCWDEHMPRIFEFLYHLNQCTNLPKEYVKIACQSLVCVKNHEYFLQKNMWTKFISLKQ